MRLVVPAAKSSTERVGEYGLIYHVAAKNSPVADTRYRLLWPFGASGREIRQILRTEQPDLIEISDKYTLPMLAGFLRKSWIKGIQRRPALVGTSHERMDDTAGAYFGLPGAITRIYMKQYYFPMFDAHIANSAYTAGELLPASKGHRLPRDLVVLPMGVEISDVSRTPEARSALVEEAGVPQDANLLLYVGRLATEKNLPVLAHMLQYLPSTFYLLVAGAGPLEPWLRQQGDRIKLLGHIDRQRVPHLYAGAGAFVHANPREPFGIAPLEAMAAGLPLVAPNAGGVLSYASPENAWLAEPDPKAFAEAVKAVFTHDEQRDSKAAKARDTAMQHRWPVIAARYFQQFDSWIADRGRWN